MFYKRILTVQDISCVGQCSMTVAMPILSACGHETCILPTAMLSTHTGGFGKPVILRFGEHLDEIWRHWKENGITFDAVLVGYLGSVAAIEVVSQVIDNLLSPDGMVIVDPVMGDHGKLYSGFDMQYVEEMKALCRKADVILPNITEAALLSGMAYQDVMDQDYVNSLLEGLVHSEVILTGVGYAPEETGAVLYQEGKTFYYPQPKLGGNFHGTGDVFAACFTGARMCGKNAEDALVFAADFTSRTIQTTLSGPAHWYGIKFEPILHEIQQMLMD